jgi:hypothetical protein
LFTLVQRDMVAEGESPRRSEGPQRSAS